MSYDAGTTTAVGSPRTCTMTGVEPVRPPTTLPIDAAKKAHFLQQPRATTAAAAMLVSGRKTEKAS